MSFAFADHIDNNDTLINDISLSLIINHLHNWDIFSSLCGQIRHDLKEKATRYSLTDNEKNDAFLPDKTNRITYRHRTTNFYGSASLQIELDIQLHFLGNSTFGISYNERDTVVPMVIAGKYLIFKDNIENNKIYQWTFPEDYATLLTKVLTNFNRKDNYYSDYTELKEKNFLPPYESEKFE